MSNLKLLREELSYDPISGNFTWVKNGRGQTKRAGVVAGCPHSGGYVRIHTLKKTYFAHRLAVLFMTGEWPKHEVDHRNGIRNDNKWINLREATTKENRRNCSGQTERRKSRFKGVVQEHHSKRWRAQITVDGRTIKLGHFDLEEDAASAYRVAAVQYHGEFAKW